MCDNVQRENRKTLPKFLLILLGAAVLGGVLGFMAGWMGYSSASDFVVEAVDYLIGAVIPWLIPAASLVLLAAAVWQYWKAKTLFAAWDGDAEEPVDTADMRLNVALLMTSIVMVLNFFLLPASWYIAGELAPILADGFFILAMIAIVILQQKVVDLTKRMNPEKRGSVYDLKFRKKWMDSCDEAEQRQIGQAACRAYQIATMTCLVLWVVLLILDIIFDIGLLPVFVVLLLLAVLQVSYILECIRLSGRKNKREQN